MGQYFSNRMNIKNDLLHKEKRWYMVKFPDSYAKQVETDLRRAREYYKDTFQVEIAELTEGEIEPTSILGMLPQLIPYAKLAIEIFGKVKSKIKELNEHMLQKYFIEKYKFRMWDEIEF